MVLIGVAVERLVGLAATTAGALGSWTVVENAGLEDAALLVFGAASTMRIASSPELPDRVENDEVAGDGVALMAGAPVGGEISLRIVPPSVGLELASGTETMGGSVLEDVLESVGVAGGGW
jgi:hypothetical protein